MTLKKIFHKLDVRNHSHDSINNYLSPFSRLIIDVSKNNKLCIIGMFGGSVLVASFEALTLSTIYLLISILTGSDLPVIFTTISQAVYSTALIETFHEKFINISLDQFRALLTILIGFIAILLQSIVTYMSNISRGIFAARATTSATKTLFTSILDMRHDYSRDIQQGQLISYVQKAPLTIKRHIDCYGNLLMYSLLSTTYAIVAFKMSWQLFLFTSGAILIVYTIQSIIQPKIRQSSQTLLDNEVTVSKKIVDDLSNLRQIRIDNLTSKKLDYLTHLLYDLEQSEITNSLLLNLPPSLMKSLPALVFIAIGLTTFSLGYKFENDTLALLGTFFIAIQRLNSSSLNLLSSHSKRISNEANVKFLNSILRLCQLREVDNKFNMPDHINSFGMSNVSYKHLNACKYSLTDITFDISFGKKIAIVGQSGSGKSTLVDLLSGIIAPSSGKCFLNKNTLEDFSCLYSEQIVSIASQNSSLFYDSILENIIASNPLDYTLLYEAAKFAQIDSFINSLPDSYQTIVSTDLANLSGGQIQRICLARSFYSKPKILILDEPTSGLDALTEASIINSIDQYHLVHKSTIIMVTHRINTIIGYDAIIVLKDGKINSFGNHIDLLASCSYYKELYTSSLQS